MKTTTLAVLLSNAAASFRQRDSAQVDHGLREALLHREQADGIEHAGGHHEKRKQRN